MDIDGLLISLMRRNASDLHLTAGVPPFIRVNGKLFKLSKPVLKPEETQSIAKQLLGKKDLEQLDNKGEVDFSYIIPDIGFFRVNIYQQRRSVGIAIRILNPMISNLDELGLPPVLATMARRNQGLILITGPTGSGKSTTMAAMANLLNSEKKLHIITLEDPIEYLHKHNKSIITQREIGRDSTTFAGALRASLRQDPDVIMIGEMRDLETIAIAVTAAETGHLVIATLHTSSAAQTVERVIDSFPSGQQQQIRVQLANTLVGIVSQRLVPLKDNAGRIVAAEVLLCNSAVRNLIRESKVHQLNSIIEINRKLGMQTMDKHLQAHYKEGRITKETALEYSQDEDGMLEFIKTEEKHKNGVG